MFSRSCPQLRGSPVLSSQLLRPMASMIQCISQVLSGQSSGGRLTGQILTVLEAHLKPY